MRRTLESTGVFKTWDFFKVKIEPRTSEENSVKATGHGCSCEHTCLFADFCDFTVTTTRRKSVPFVTSNGLYEFVQAPIFTSKIYPRSQLN